jgi:molecular chaperone DnaK
VYQGDTIIGIDLGTTNSVVSVLEGEEPIVIPNAEGELKTPSVVCIEDDGSINVGEIARRQGATKPGNTIFSVKRLIGHTFSELDESVKNMPYKVIGTDNDDITIVIGEKEYAPEEISSEILKKLKADAEEYLGKEITQAIITVPAYFDDRQRSTTKEAGRLAGLDVLRLVNEPTAASLAYGLDKDKGETVAVYDFGGGTFDMTILEISERTFEVIVTQGDSQLGGDDLDAALVQLVVNEFFEEHQVDLTETPGTLLRIKEAVEKAKCDLSSVRQTTISLPFLTQKDGEQIHYERQLTRSEFEELIEPLVQRSIDICEKALEEAKKDIDDINKVIMVGGTTRIPLVSQMVEEYFDKPPFKGVNPDEIVAMGAAVQAGVMSGQLDEVVLLDVTPHSLGIETRDDGYSVIVEHNTTIPIKKAKTFTTTERDQEFVNVHVLQGAEKHASDNISLGKFLLRGIEPGPPGQPRIRVAFQINADGILEITAQDMASGEERNLTISHVYLTEEERKEREKAQRRRAKEERKQRKKSGRRGKAQESTLGKRSLGVASPGSSRNDDSLQSAGEEEAQPPQIDVSGSDAASGTASGVGNPSEPGFAVLDDSQDEDRPESKDGQERSVDISGTSPPLPDDSYTASQTGIESKINSPKAVSGVYSAVARRISSDKMEVIDEKQEKPKKKQAAPEEDDAEEYTFPGSSASNEAPSLPADPDPNVTPPEEESAKLDEAAEDGKEESAYGIPDSHAPGVSAEKSPPAEPEEEPEQQEEAEGEGQDMWSPMELIEDLKSEPGDPTSLLPEEEAPAASNSSTGSAKANVDVVLCPDGELGDSIKLAISLADAKKDDANALAAYTDVLPRMQQLAEIYQYDPDLQANTAKMLALDGKPDDAVRHAKAMMDSPASDAQKELKLLALIVEKAPEDMNARLLRSRVYLKEAMYEGAIKDLEAALKVEPGAPEAERLLQEAYEAMLEARYTPSADLKLVKVLLRQNKIDESIRRLQKVINEPQYRERAQKVLGFCYWQKQMYYPAFQQFKHLPATEEIKDILYRLSSDLESAGDFGHAYEVMDFLSKQDAGFRDVEYRLKTLQGRLERASAKKPKVADTEPDYATTPATSLKGSRFVILEELNRGSMGVVFKAKDTSLDEIVALKVLNDFLCSDPLAVERFKREARAAKKLTHQHIVRINDFFEIKNKKMLSMEYIEGDDMKRMLAMKRSLAVEELKHYVLQICEGLEFAHKRGVIHRDVKPANIMITMEQEVKITDFGIAKNLQSEDMTTGSRILGTPLYMAPEQIEGRQVDARSDIYALGIMMYELISGNPPFMEGNIEYQHIHMKPPPLPTSVPADVQELIMKAISKAMDDRFQSVAELGDALADL